MEEMEDKKKKNRIIGQEVRKIQQERTGKNLDDEVVVDAPITDSEDNIAEIHSSANIADESLYQSADVAMDSLFGSKSEFLSKGENFDRILTAVPQENDIADVPEAIVEIPTKTPIEERAGIRSAPTQEMDMEEIDQLKEVEEEIKQVATQQVSKKAPNPTIPMPNKPGKTSTIPPTPISKPTTIPITHGQDSNNVATPPPADEMPKQVSSPITRRWAENVQIRHDRSIATPPPSQAEANDEQGLMRTEQMPITPRYNVNAWVTVAVASGALLLGLLLMLFLRPIPQTLESKEFVQLLTVRSEEYSPHLMLIGQIAWNKKQDILAPSSGQLINLYVESGNVVKAGQVLAEILVNSQSKKTEVVIKAPFDGEITQLSADKGTRITMNTKILSMVSQLRVINVNIPNICYAKLTGFSKDLEAKILYAPDTECPGKIGELFFGESQSSLKIIPNKENPLPNSLGIGYPVWVKMALPHKYEAILIPKNAIMREHNGNNFVFIAKRNKGTNSATIFATNVLVGMTNEDGSVEILQGLYAGQDVVTFANTGMNNLQDGLKVTVK